MPREIGDAVPADAIRLSSKRESVLRNPATRIDGIRTPSLVSAEGNLRRKFEALGGTAALGEPVAKEEGKIWTFANGSCICYNANLFTAFELHGAIYAKWLALGGLAWGIPCTDETPTPDNVGRYNHFNDNTASIYWTQATGLLDAGDRGSGNLGSNPGEMGTDRLGAFGTWLSGDR